MSFLFSFSFCLPLAIPNLHLDFEVLRPGTPLAPCLGLQMLSTGTLLCLSCAKNYIVQYLTFFLFHGEGTCTLTLGKQNAGLGLGEVVENRVLWTRAWGADWLQ